MADLRSALGLLPYGGNFVDDPFAAAAMRTRQSVAPIGGRPEGNTTKVMQGLGALPLQVLMGIADLPRQAFEASNEAYAGGAYNPAPVMDLASMVVGFPGVPKGALGSSMAKSALPMDEASRMARARTQGFTRDAYRGEGRPLEGAQYEVYHPERYDTGFLGGDAVYATNFPRIANSYALMKGNKLPYGQAAENVLPLKVKMENPFVISGEEKMRLAGLPQMERDSWLSSILAKGHDGVIVRTHADLKNWNDPQMVAQYLIDKYGTREAALANTKVVKQTDDATREALELIKSDKVPPTPTPPPWKIHEEYVIPNPDQQLRSRFAVFDPRNIGGGPLLGGLAGATPIGLEGFVYANNPELAQ